MNTSTDATPIGSRPYRSHKVPACDLCRNRKIRCNIDVAGEPCRFCRERHLSCEYTSKATVDDGLRPPPAKRRRTHADDHDVATPVKSTERGLAQFPSIAGTSPEESSIMLNPPMAEDIEVLEHYLSSGRYQPKPHGHSFVGIARNP